MIGERTPTRTTLRDPASLDTIDSVESLGVIQSIEAPDTQGTQGTQETQDTPFVHDAFGPRIYCDSLEQEGRVSVQEGGARIVSPHRRDSAHRTSVPHRVENLQRTAIMQMAVAREHSAEPQGRVKMNKEQLLISMGLTFAMGLWLLFNLYIILWF